MAMISPNLELPPCWPWLASAVPRVSVAVPPAPPNCDDEFFTKVLKRTWSSYLNKSLKCWCHSDVWLEKYDRNKGNPVRYCSRQEDISFFRELQGDNKVLVGSSSFLL